MAPAQVPPMSKPYDLQNLLQRCKARGLDLVEEEAKIVFHELVGWAQDSAALSPGKVDDLVALGLPELEKLVMPLIDKIDGEQG